MAHYAQTRGEKGGADPRQGHGGWGAALASLSPALGCGREGLRPGARDTGSDESSVTRLWLQAGVRIITQDPSVASGPSTGDIRTLMDLKHL